MCGINGILRLRTTAPTIDPSELRRTRDAMAARGPDGFGEWLSPGGELALGHRRLAIIDLSPGGAQPMASPDGRYVVVFNGEIYNYRELRADLERQGVVLRTASDTEVLLYLVAREGLDGIGRLRGMFAFAVWDDVEKSLILARDAFGIKPLYYAAGRDTLRFASQVKALEASGAVPTTVDPAAIAGFLLWGSVPGPRTIRAAIRGLPAGHALRVVDGWVGEPQRFPTRRLWSVDAPEQALEASVRAHLVADVPVAVFLSSGMDSAVTAALARRALPEPPTSFTLTFEGWEGQPRDEAPLARRVAESLGLRHRERRLTPRDVATYWSPAIAAMDQPAIDGFNTFLVSRVAHEEGIKVALSGLGGDELTGSYPSFRQVPRLARTAMTLDALPGGRSAWRVVAPGWSRRRPKLSGLVDLGRTIPGAYFLRRGLFLPEELPSILGDALAEDALATYCPLADAAARLAAPRPEGETKTSRWREVQCLESAIYLRQQLLRDSDWASMASGLELRLPFVDVTLWSAFSAHDFEPARSSGKAALVRRVAPELPAEVLARPKTGFLVPVAEWMLPKVTGPATLGSLSRRLAVRLLSEFGVEVRGIAAA